MTTSVPRSIMGDSDVRESEREGLPRSVRSLDGGADAPDADRPRSSPSPRLLEHRAEMDAIAAQMARFATHDRASGTDHRGLEPQALRSAVADIARRQAVLDGLGGSAHRDAGAGTFRIPVPRGDALDAAEETGSRAVSGPGGASPLRGLATDLGAEVAETFARFSRDLHEAIHAADVRPAVQDLDRQVRRIGRAVEGIGAGLSSSDTLTRIGERTREMRDLLATAAAPPPVAASGPDGARNPGQALAGPGGAKLEGDPLSRDVRLHDIGQPAGLDAQGSAGLIDDLSRRVDEIHGSLRSKLSESRVDTRPLESLVRGLAERIGEAREASSDIDQLESVMRDLARKAEGSTPDSGLRGALSIEDQIARLSERLERSEASLKGLDGLEHSLGQLFSQFEMTRQVAIDAAETAARTAARDTLRAAMQNPSLGLKADGSPALADQMARGIEDLRAMQDLADRRTQAILADMQGALERLSLQVNGGVRPGVRAPEAARDASPPAFEAGGWRRKGRAADAGRGPEGSRSEAVARGPIEGGAEREIDPADQLIEPGFGKASLGRTEPRFEAGGDRAYDADPIGPAEGAAQPAGAGPQIFDGEGPASFIAAARRAAQAAQASVADAAAQKVGDRRSATGRRNATPGTGSMERAKAYLARRRRPILLTLAALVVLVGALEVVKLGLDSSDPTRVGMAGIPTITKAPAPASARPIQVAAEPAAIGEKPAVPATQASAAAPLPDAAANAAPARAPLPTFAAGPGAAAKPQAAALDGISEGLRGLASAGNPAAQYEVGLRYAEGRGVARDPKQAATWFDKAGQQGLAPAQYRLGSIFEKGIGVERDPALAMDWYVKAAEAGNVRAMHNLAVMAAEGAAGKPDYAKAARWFSKASSFGVRDSQFNLAILYARGLGIEQSLAQSYTWFAVAAGEGDDDAAKKRDEVAQKLDAKTLASAKAAAEAYRAAPQNPAANEVQAPAGGWDAVAPRASAQAVGARVSRL